MTRPPFRKTKHPKEDLSELDPLVATKRAKIPKTIYKKDEEAKDRIVARTLGDALRDLCYDVAKNHRLVSANVQAETISREILDPDEVEPHHDVMHYNAEVGMVIGMKRNKNVDDVLQLARKIVSQWRDNVGKRISAPETNELVARIADALALAKGFNHGYEATTDINKYE